MGLNLKTTTGKLIASASLLGAAAAVAGMGTYGAFTSSTEASTTVTNATMKIDMVANGGSNNLQLSATGLLPGDKVQRLITLNNSGTADLAALTLTTAPTVSSVLTTDTANGLQIVIESCDQAWTAGAQGAAYTCGGTKKSVLASRPVIGSNIALSQLASLTGGQNDNLLVTQTLPSTAGDTFQGATSTVNFTFTATQRGTTVK
ncbi:TasA family protein [Arthrobacter globiformis]|uniref:TasA family protein n=1 Tax=Arthrobacter globiformis TaxID=1665 RepID=UPI0027940201|nr:TasA family protein [Arthrobacter globiformis]MDQ0620078.1 spore coat-associated protein N [Arthrobacter globiformis]